MNNTIRILQNGYNKKIFTISEIIKKVYKSIDDYDIYIKSFTTLNRKDALKQANKLDANFSKDCSKTLYGIPIAVKDNFSTIGLATTACSNVLSNYLPVYNATIIEKLLNAGAIIIGKTNMDAWAHGSSTETSDFFTTRNPWNTDYLPGGSSGGSAASVSAGFVPIAIGSETAGSIRQPASWCGVTGFKPTYGSVSRYGLISMCSSTDCPGPIANTAEDCELVYRVISGRDRKDATSHDIKKVLHKSNKIIGLPKQYFSDKIAPEYIASVMETTEIFKSLGYRFIDIDLMDSKYAVAVYTIVQRSEVSSNLSRYDGNRFGKDRTMFGQEAKRRISLGTYVLSSGYYDAYYLKAQKVRTLICQDFKRVFKQVDYLLAPTTPNTALRVGATKDQYMFGELQDELLEASSLAGLPAISMPCGFDRYGLPYGFQVIGPQNSDYRLLALGIEYQQITDWHKRKPPILK